MEYNEVEKEGCSIGPNPLKTDDLFKHKKVVVFGLPGAFTPTCSAKHVPSYLHNYDKLKAKGVDTIACMLAPKPGETYVADFGPFGSVSVDVT